MSDAQQALDAAKKLCIEGEDQIAHEFHRKKLEDAYTAFAQQDPSDSNPASGSTNIQAHVAVKSDLNP